MFDAAKSIQDGETLSLEQGLLGLAVRGPCTFREADRGLCAWHSTMDQAGSQ